MKTQIEKSWHKANDSDAITYKQIEYINTLTEDNVFAQIGSTSQIMRCLTKSDAAEIIEALKAGNEIEFI